MAIRYTSSFDKTIPFSDTDNQLHLVANTAVDITLPGDKTHKYTVLFGLSSNSNLFVGYNVTATIPAAGTSTDTSGIEFITPDSQRYAIGGDVLSFISPDADTYVGISLRSIPN